MEHFGKTQRLKEKKTRSKHNQKKIKINDIIPNMLITIINIHRFNFGLEPAYDECYKNQVLN